MSSKELKKLDGLVKDNIIRHGRVKQIETDKIVFENGEEIPTDDSTLHIDCSAHGTRFKEVKEKIFDGRNMFLQIIQFPFTCTSAAMVASMELLYPGKEDEDKKNEVCSPMAAPEHPWQWFDLNYKNDVNAEAIGNMLGIRS